MPWDCGTLSVDGVALATSVSYPIGHWEYDPWDDNAVWVVDDDTVADLSAKAPVLADGARSITAAVHNSVGEVSSDTWQFTLAAPPYATKTVPRPGTMDVWAPVACDVGDNSAATVAATMTVDGDLVPASYTPGTKTFAWTPAAPHADMTTHTVVVEMTDAGGLSATESWQFKVQTRADAVWSAVVPADGATVTTSTPSVSVHVVDQLPVSTAIAVLDGVTKPSALEYPIGHWESDMADSWYVVDDPRVADIRASVGALTDGIHTAAVTETNAVGFADTTSWSFRVAAPPAVSGLAPAPGSDTAVVSPTIRATVKDNSTDPVGVVLTVDGAPVSGT
ncbi:MAG: hypothetical protein FDZ75_09135, partial [Actinobacteria bacterium]